MPGHYLDHNATTPLRPEARAAMEAAFDLVGNPSSVHGFGRAVRRVVEDARQAVADLVGVAPSQVIFTSGGTEANNLALTATGRPVLVSAIEHDSVLEAAGGAVRVPATPQGIVDLDALDRALAGAPPSLVSVMLVNNETGVIQPIAEVVRIARAHGALVHSDGVQAAGKLPLDMATLGVDLLTLSAHKIGGPSGIGALVTTEGVPIASLLRGGGQERRRRAGTENLTGIAGFGAAARVAASDIDRMADLAVLRDRLESAARDLVPETRIFGAAAPRVGTTTCLSLPGVPSTTQVMALDLAGVAVSSGSACSSGKVKPSHVLQAMGASGADAGSALRVSLGWTSEAEDVDAFLAAWGALARRSGVGRTTAA